MPKLWSIYHLPVVKLKFPSSNLIQDCKSSTEYEKVFEIPTPGVFSTAKLIVSPKFPYCFPNIKLEGEGIGFNIISS